MLPVAGHLFPVSADLHAAQRRRPPRDVSRNSQPRRRHDRSLSRPGNTYIQFRIFSDYGSHIARFPAIQAYHREHQPPCLLLWGRHDPFFEIDEIMAYHRVLDALEIHVFESAHQLLETHHRECGELVSPFIREVEEGAFEVGPRWRERRRRNAGGMLRQ